MQFRNSNSLLAQLIQILLKEKNFKELQAVSGSREKRHELYKQYGIWNITYDGYKKAELPHREISALSIHPNPNNPAPIYLLP